MSLASRPQTLHCATTCRQVSNKLQGKAGRLVDKVAAVTLDAIDGPMQELISKLVDDLEVSWELLLLVVFARGWPEFSRGRVDCSLCSVTSLPIRVCVPEPLHMSVHPPCRKRRPRPQRRPSWRFASGWQSTS
jgi:hypothetical protein